MTTQAHQTIDLGRRQSLATSLGLIACAVALVLAAIAMGDVWPPRSISDPMGVSGVQ